jgi:energy-coupling factor transporter transmembrane protein EcfT
MQASSPAARLLCLVILVTSVATAPLSRTGLVSGVAVALTVLVIARPPLRQTLRRIGAGAVLISAVLLPLALVGETQRAMLLMARAAAALLVAVAFAGTLKLSDVASGCRALGIPSYAVRVIETMLRQVSVLREVGQRIVLARKLRGARGTSASGEVFATLLLHSAERAQRSALAMRLRGFGGQSAHGARLRASDAPLLVAVCAAAIAIHVWHVPLGGWSHGL